MSFSSLKDIPAMAFYFASVICLVLANVMKDNNLSFYYILLLLGVVFFFLGVFKRMRTKR
jgi:hypothetical protein